MKESDYFEDFGEGNDDEEEEEEEVKPEGKKGKVLAKGKDKLMGELEQLALGDEEVRLFLMFTSIC
jgi:hypothetical protein